MGFLNRKMVKFSDELGAQKTRQAGKPELAVKAHLVDVPWITALDDGKIETGPPYISDGNNPSFLVKIFP